METVAVANLEIAISAECAVIGQRTAMQVGAVAAVEVGINGSITRDRLD